MHWKLGTSKYDSRMWMAVSVYYTCIYARQKCALSKGCNFCYIHIYDVGVGVSSCFCPCYHRSPNTSMHKDIQGAETPAPISFRIYRHLIHYLSALGVSDKIERPNKRSLSHAERL